MPCGRPGLEPDAVRSWQESLSVAARRLEAAWLALEGVVGTEVAQRLKIADQVARWRRPVWPILIVAVVASISQVGFKITVKAIMPKFDKFKRHN